MSDTPWIDRLIAGHRNTLGLRAAYLAGVEQRSLVERGRGLTEAELVEAMAGYPGDLPTVR